MIVHHSSDVSVHPAGRSVSSITWIAPPPQLKHYTFLCQCMMGYHCPVTMPKLGVYVCICVCVNMCTCTYVMYDSPTIIQLPLHAHAKNFRVIIDSDLNFQRHIKNTVKVCNYFIRDIRRVRNAPHSRCFYCSDKCSGTVVDLTIVTLYYILFQESI